MVNTERILLYAGVGFFASMFLMTKFTWLRPPKQSTLGSMGNLSNNINTNNININNADIRRY